MTATAGSQVFGPWYDVIGAVVISGMFFYLAFAQASFPLSTRQRWPAFVSKRFCIVFGVGGSCKYGKHACGHGESRCRASVESHHCESRCERRAGLTD